MAVGIVHPHLTSLILLALLPTPTDMVRVSCFSAMDRTTFTCINLVWGGLEQSDCCLNPNYCFQTEGGGVSTLCRPVSEWSGWSEWSPCSVSCEEGVQQRRRVCIGSGECTGKEKLQARPCIDQPCCAVDGGWSPWTSWGPCSVTCAVGHKERHRTCTQPKPLCGGRCHGVNDQRLSCNTQQICPTHGAWAPWGAWGPCSGTCRPDGPGRVPTRSHRRTCSQPAPSVMPAGRSCLGQDTDSGPCPSLPSCPVAGSWGAWSPPTPCPVTCGVGRVERHRACDSPSPRHNGHPCPGSTHDHNFCNTRQPCPVDGLWSEWGTWSLCERKGFSNIKCNFYRGIQERERSCLGKDHAGKICPLDWFDSRACYDVQGCRFDTYVWTDWGEWGLCQPPCGADSRRTRRRTCQAVYPDDVHINENVAITGSPRLRCAELDGQRFEVMENRTCLHMPTCR